MGNIFKCNECNCHLLGVALESHSSQTGHGSYEAIGTTDKQEVGGL